MKTLILGLEVDDPEVLFNVPGLVHLQGLWEEGIRGVLVSEPRLSPDSRWRSLLAGRILDASEQASPGPMIWDALDGHGAPIDPILVGMRADGTFTSERGRQGDPVRDDGTSSSTMEPGSEGRAARIRSLFRDLRGRMASRPWNLAMLVDAIPAPGLGGAHTIVDCAVALDHELAGTLDQVNSDGIELSVLMVALRGARSDGQESELGSRPMGSFVLNSTRGLPAGELQGVGIIDLAPMLLALSDRSIPPEWQGRSGMLETLSSGDSDDDDQEAVLDRLRGLGYLA